MFSPRLGKSELGGPCVKENSRGKQGKNGNRPTPREKNYYQSEIDKVRLEGKKLEAGDVEPEESWLSERKSRHRLGRTEELWQVRDDDSGSAQSKARTLHDGAQAVEKEDDSAIAGELQTVLELDPDLRSYGLRARVVRGKALLYGVVDTLSEKTRAHELAQGVPGVTGVENLISISTDGQIEDKDVEFEVSEELNKEVDTKHISAKSSRGVVTLLGTSDNLEEVEVAKKAASRARGVKDVVNKVKLQK